MAKPRETKSGKWELCVQHKLLPRRLFFTFDTEDAAIQYDSEVSKYLAAGVVPPALAAAASGERQTNGASLVSIMRDWIGTGTLSKTDADLLTWLMPEPLIKNTYFTGLTYKWVESWVSDMKLRRNLAPSSIRQRVQALSKAIDAYLRRNPELGQLNPLKLLPRGYSIYNEVERRILKADGKEAKYDIERDRRLTTSEIEKIRLVLTGTFVPEGKERGIGLPDGDALPMLFEVILMTGVRLREAYTIRRENVNLQDWVIKIKSTKQRNGKQKYREVPVRKELHAKLSTWLKDGEGLVFPFWNGDEAELDRTSNKLSNRFRVVLDHAGCTDVTEHDLRHEATCQWYELRDKAGNWTFRPEEIHKIMGWAPGSKMAARYASFRASSLAERLRE
ncbi:integrase [Curvibacter phage PCA1]|nr:integrase [Curvibacter phage PCA1]